MTLEIRPKGAFLGQLLVHFWCCLGPSLVEFGLRKCLRAAHGDEIVLEAFLAPFMYPIWVQMGPILGPKLASISGKKASADSETCLVPDWGQI